MKKQQTKLFKKIAIYFWVLLLLSTVLANALVNFNAKNKVFFDATKIPKNKVGVLLGTSKILEDGSKNKYFYYRAEAASKLFKAGKIDIILISGSYESKFNDNPKDFKKELLKNGVPENKIFFDYNGTRTYNTIVSLKEVFNANQVTFISQEFHNERAIYIAENFGINAIGFNAKDVTNSLGFKTQTREYFARVKVFIDFLTNTKPQLKFRKKRTIFSSET